MNAYDIIDRLPLELAARLACDPFFVDIPVVVAEKGNIKLEMERKQAVITEKAGKRGVAVIVLQTLADDLSRNLQFGPMILKPSFQVIENVELNNDDAGTGKSARKIARRLRDIIKNFNVKGLVADMKAGQPCIEPADLSEISPALVGCQVNFECLEVSNEDQRQVQDVVFTASPPSSIVMSCPTPGAAIWFTTDDSFPYPGTTDDFPGSTSQLYSSAVAVETGQVIRAGAFVENQIPSGINRITIAPL